MKYIRTKDGIFEDEYVHIKVDKDGYAMMEYKGDFYDVPEKVKQADTIEELCDEIVVVEIGIGQHINYTKKEWLSHEGAVGSPTCKVYGAIWTDKGLIYVAKMNENGELELL